MLHLTERPRARADPCDAINPPEVHPPVPARKRQTTYPPPRNATRPPRPGEPEGRAAPAAALRSPDGRVDQPLGGHGPGRPEGRRSGPDHGDGPLLG